MVKASADNDTGGGVQNQGKIAAAIFEHSLTRGSFIIVSGINNFILHYETYFQKATVF